MAGWLAGWGKPDCKNRKGVRRGGGEGDTGHTHWPPMVQVPAVGTLFCVSRNSPDKIQWRCPRCRCLLPRDLCGDMDGAMN